MIILADDPIWKYTFQRDGERVCQCSKVPANILKEIRETDEFYFFCNGKHLVRFEDDCIKNKRHDRQKP